MRESAKKLSLLVFIQGFFLIVTGSYAIYRGAYTGENDNKIVTDSASLEFLESNTNVINMKSMFYNAGSNATTQSVKIPDTTGSLTNTTSKWYGSSESVYAEPCSGKYFTLS